MSTPGGLWEMLGVPRSPVVRQQPSQPRVHRLLRHARGRVAVSRRADQQQPQKALHPGGECDHALTSPGVCLCQISTDGAACTFQDFSFQRCSTGRVSQTADSLLIHLSLL